MASVPSEPRPVLGRLDKAGRLIAADAELEALQRQAGAGLGQKLALPQVAAVAQLARKLRIAVSRPAIAASLYCSGFSDSSFAVASEGEDLSPSLRGAERRSNPCLFIRR